MTLCLRVRSTTRLQAGALRISHFILYREVGFVALFIERTVASIF